MLQFKDMVHHSIMFGIGHELKANKIPMEISHLLPTFYNQKFLEIASANVAVFSLCIARNKLRPCGGDRYVFIVGKKVVDMVGTDV